MSLKKIILWTSGVALFFLSTGAAFFLLRPVDFSFGVTYAREALHGIENHQVTVAGRSVHYLATGPAAGPVVVLVHGLGGSAEDWLELAPYLVKAGFRVYMPDLIGYGRSPRPAEFSYSVGDEAAMVTGFMNALHLQQIDLGGWSMGGWIVQRVAGAHPERIRRLILFDSAGLYAAPTWNTNLFTPTTAEEIDQLQALLMPHPPTVPAFVARDILRFTRERAWVIHRALNSMLTGSDTTDALLPRLKMPVLIAWGELDRITPLVQGEAMHRLVPQSELVVAPGCGHLAPRQCTTQMGPRVVAFLQR